MPTGAELIRDYVHGEEKTETTIDKTFYFFDNIANKTGIPTEYLILGTIFLGLFLLVGIFNGNGNQKTELRTVSNEISSLNSGW